MHRGVAQGQLQLALEAPVVQPPTQLSFMSESRRLDNGRLKRELKLALRYPTVHRGLVA